jgi:hypothetical protein
MDGDIDSLILAEGEIDGDMLGEIEGLTDGLRL